MMLYLELKAEYPDPETAQRILNALGPDNDGYVETEVAGSVIVFRMKAEKSGTLRNTADDLMACIKIAEEAVGLASER